MKAKDLIDVGSITPDLLNPHLRRRFMGGGGTTINNETEETTTLPITICRLATTANILLDGSVTTVDGVSINDGDNVLVCEQTTLSANGIYFAYATGWVRYTDIKPAMLVAVSEGTANGDTVWMLTSNNFVIGTDNIVFQRVLPVDGLPAGTVNQTLRPNGTDWVANEYLLSILSGTDSFLHLKNSGDNTIDLGTNHWRIKQTSNIIYITDISPAIDKDYIQIRGGSTKDIRLLFPIKIEYSNADATISKPALDISRGGTSIPINTQTLLINDGQHLSSYIASILGYSSTYGLRIENNGVAGSGHGLQVVTSEGAGNVLLSLNTTTEKLKVKNDGTIISNSLTANTYLGANANKEIVSIPSPNLIKYSTINYTSNTDVWTNVEELFFMVEANVAYELTIKLAMGNASSRNGTIRLFSDAATYIFRPFISGAFNYLANTNIIYQPNEEELHPIVMDNETQFDFQINSNNATMELKGIFVSTINIANCILQMKTRDIGSDFIVKSYSYLKLSR